MSKGYVVLGSAEQRRLQQEAKERAEQDRREKIAKFRECAQLVKETDAAARRAQLDYFEALKRWALAINERDAVFSALHPRAESTISFAPTGLLEQRAAEKRVRKEGL